MRNRLQQMAAFVDLFQKLSTQFQYGISWIMFKFKALSCLSALTRKSEICWNASCIERDNARPCDNAALPLQYLDCSSQNVHTFACDFQCLDVMIWSCVQYLFLSNLSIRRTKRIVLESENVKAFANTYCNLTCKCRRNSQSLCFVRYVVYSEN